MNSAHYYYKKLWSFCSLNPYVLKPEHIALYFYIICIAESLGFKESFGLPTSSAMHHLGMKNYKTYAKYLKLLFEVKLLFIVAWSKNQYQSNIIALVENTAAKQNALAKNTTPLKNNKNNTAKQKRSGVDTNSNMQNYWCGNISGENASILEEEVFLKNTSTENALVQNTIPLFGDGLKIPHIENFKTSALHDIKFTKEFNGVFVNPTYLPGWLTAFNNRLHFTGDTDKTELGYRNHFIRWLVKIPDYKIRDPATYEVLNHTPPETSNITPTDQYFLDLLKKSK